MRIRTKIISGYLLIGLIMALTGTIILVRQEEGFDTLAEVRNISLYHAQSADSSIRDAVKESLYPFFRDDDGWKRAFYAAIGRFDREMKAFRVMAGKDGEAKAREAQIVATLLQTREATVRRAEELFRQYGEKGRLDPVLVGEYHALTEKIEAEVAELVRYERGYLDDIHRMVTETHILSCRVHYIVGFFIVVLAIVLGLCISGAISRPISRLTDAAGRMAGGDLDGEVDTSARDETGELARAFDAMRENLKEKIEVLDAEAAARSTSEETIRGLLNASFESIFLLDPEGTVITANDSLARRLGVDADAIVGRNVFDLLPPDLAASRKKRLAEVVRSGKSLRFEDEREGRIIDNSLYPLGNGDGGVAAVAVFAEDVTEARAAEKGLKEVCLKLEEHAIALEREKNAAERARLLAEAADRAKSDFLANMSHELRTPLNAIIGFADVLKDGLGGKLSPKQESYVDNIRTSGRHLHAMIEDVLELAQMETGAVAIQVSPFRLREVFVGALSRFEEKAVSRGISLSFEVEPAVAGEIWGDPAKLGQILRHLLSNAVKFTPDQGRVHVAARSVGDAGSIPALPLPYDRDFIELSVEDSGIGMRAEDLPKIFQGLSQLEPPSTKSHGGAGVGLVLAKKLVEQVGGIIRVESEVGRGSRFIVVIPVEWGAGLLES